ncbi:MAG: AraC family transcriptional regulator [Balneolales bacterium]|nr:AraC family transcriptional regulator [Balneolales bacterium]
MNSTNPHNEILFRSEKPSNEFLRQIVDYYFYINTASFSAGFKPEYIVPFPRVTFGYFFDKPFHVFNKTQNEAKILSIAVSRISTDQIFVRPLQNHIQILGAHLKPYTLSLFTQQSIQNLSWVIHPKEILGKQSLDFMQKADAAESVDELFEIAESSFLDAIEQRETGIVSKAIEFFDSGHTAYKRISEVASALGISEKTLYNQFKQQAGCSPKDYIKLSRLKKSMLKMLEAQSNLTGIALESEFYDQSHFVHEIRNITGQSPKKLQNKIPDFRFLQF